MDNELKDFYSQYKSNNHVSKFMDDLKANVLSKNPNASGEDIINTFIIDFPIDLLSHYHKWLTTHYSLISKDN